MTTPNYQQMSRQELKTYIRQHPTDDDAMRELFINRRDPNRQMYPPPSEMSYEEIETIFRAKIEELS